MANRAEISSHGDLDDYVSPLIGDHTYIYSLGSLRIDIAVDRGDTDCRTDYHIDHHTVYRGIGVDRADTPGLADNIEIVLLVALQVLWRGGVLASVAAYRVGPYNSQTQSRDGHGNSHDG